MNTFKLATIASFMAFIAACTPLKQTPEPKEPTLSCTPTTSNDQLVGNWLSVSSEKDVAGAIRTLYTLNADGTMDYIQQVKRAKAPSQGIHESGCWHRSGQVLVLQTAKSNGVPVNLDDPIYTGRYQIKSLTEAELRLESNTGDIRAKKMSPGYRLPF